MDHLHGAFERDLRAWLERVYDARAAAARARLQQRVFRILDQEKRWLAPLTALTVIGVYLLPIVGPGSVFGTLALLYVGSVASGLVTMRRTERLEGAPDPGAEASRAAEHAWLARPSLGPEERARVQRIMNLARATSVPGAATLLRAELREAMEDPGLAGWRFLWEVEDLIRLDPTALA